MDSKTAFIFIDSVIEALQSICNGCVEFHRQIVLIGHLNLKVDENSSVNFVVEENLTRDTSFTVEYISNSFIASKNLHHAESSSSTKCSAKRGSNTRYNYAYSESASDLPDEKPCIQKMEVEPIVQHEEPHKDEHETPERSNIRVSENSIVIDSEDDEDDPTVYIDDDVYHDNEHTTTPASSRYSASFDKRQCDSNENHRRARCPITESKLMNFISYS